MRPWARLIRSSLRGSNLIRACVAALVVLMVAPAVPAQDVVLPPPGAQYDSQLGGAYPPPPGTIILSRDRADPPAPGLYNICYVNAFQTQPQETQWWLERHPDLLLRLDGELVEDPNWPGEVLLDISTPQHRQALALIVGEWIEQCARDGFDAIEADNLDTYSRSRGAIRAADSLAYAELLVDHSHRLGLAFGQKNAVELVGHARDVGFDFAIVEGCQVYGECSAYLEAFGPHVLEIEYADTDASSFSVACAERGDEVSVIRRDRNLTLPGDPTYLYETC